MKRALLAAVALISGMAFADTFMRNGATNVGPTTSLNCLADGGITCSRTSATSRGNIECHGATIGERGCLATGDQHFPFGQKTFLSTDAGFAVYSNGRAFVDGGLNVAGDISLRTNDFLDFGAGADDRCYSNGTNIRCASTWYFDSTTGGNIFAAASGNNAIALSTNGARIDLGSGSQDHFSSNGTTTNFAGPVAVTAGTGTDLPNVGGMLASNVTSVGNVGTGEDILHLYTLPANSLIVTGRGIRHRAHGTFANNANAKTVNAYFGATATSTFPLPVNIAGTWTLTVDTLRVSSSSQRSIAFFLYTDNADAAAGSKVTYTQPTANEASTISIRATGTATADNDIVQVLSTVEFL